MRFQFDVSDSQRGISFDQFLVGFGFTESTNVSNLGSSTAVAHNAAPAATSGVVDRLDFGYSIHGDDGFGMCI